MYVIAYQAQLGSPIDQFDMGRDKFGFFSEIKV